MNRASPQARAQSVEAHARAYWNEPLDGLYADLGSGPQGLAEDEAARRLDEMGPNLLKPRREATALGLFINQFRNSITLILLAGTIISAVTQDWVDALIILGIILVSASLSFLQEYGANHAADRLRAQLQIRSTVLRDGNERSLPAEEVVAGDVVLLSAGSLVPADGVLLDARDCYVSQSVLTGETFPVEKAPGSVAAEASLAQRSNCLYMGTSLRSGTGRLLIVATGVHTALGQIADRLSLRPPETDFERGLRTFGHLLTEIMLVLVLVVFAVNVLYQKAVLDSLLFAVALAVGITPQLLPAITTITLSRGAQDMAAQGVIVRRLAAIENLGSMDVLCTDKTGTLTQGVVHLDAALDGQGQPSQSVARWAYLNASLQTGLSNPLDEAITRDLAPASEGVAKVDEIPYDFLRKRLTIVVREDDQTWMISKGALANVLEVCTQAAGQDGPGPLDEATREVIQGRLAAWSEQGFRVLGVAVRPVEPQAAFTRDDEKEMIFSGFLLFFDPPKADARETIAELADLGVGLKVISGDNRLVALHVAEQLGLHVSGVLSGDEIDATRDEALWHAAERTTLFVEVDPNQKERIILALKKMGHAVGYMGDGINDAPALRAADVGISVDTAVDVAKEAADLVLLQRDLAVLKEGIRGGRRTFANTLKYIFITTSANFGNMFSMAGASLFLPFLPMLPKQILLTNFLTDFPAMNIAGDRVDPEWSDRPHRWNMHFIRDFMFTFGLVSSAFDYLTFGVLMLLLGATADQFRTGWFIESVLSELLILLVIRTQRRFYRSTPGRGLTLAVALVTLLTLWLPFSPLRGMFGFQSLPLPFLLALMPITILYLAASELAKRWFYRRVQW